MADYQRRLLAAGHLAFVFPVWWEAMPAASKGFLDRFKGTFAKIGVTNPRWTDYASVTAETPEQRAGILERTEQASAAL